MSPDIATDGRTLSPSQTAAISAGAPGTFCYIYIRKPQGACEEDLMSDNRGAAALATCAGPRRSLLQRWRRGAPLVLLLALLCSCPESSGPGDGQDPPVVLGDPDAIARGAAIYADHCGVCHGATGQGGTAGPLLRWSGADQPLSALVPLIAGNMPKGSPGRCTGKCPDYVAAYILSGFQSGKLRCDSPPPAPRRLRLLTRTEYRNTVTDLLGLPRGGGQPGCSWNIGGRFSYDPAGRTLRSVHVAGSLNGWQGTIAAGGWPLSYDGNQKLWTLQREVPAGTYQYKLVLDESQWITDPRNPDQAPDGFGGQNSVLTVRCGGAAAPDVTTGFPPENRPEGFGFDNSAEGRIVTTAHIDAYRGAAAELAKAAQQNLGAILPCDPAGGREACADTFVRRFGLRALRRPLSDAEIARWKGLVLGNADFKVGVGVALQAMLLSPAFLYRSEIGQTQPDGTARLTPYEVASALSYGLWATLPDQALLDAAASGELGTAAGIEKHARRLLADARSRDVVGQLVLQWLGADGIADKDKNAAIFPGWSAALGQAMAAETRRFAAAVIFESSGKLPELLTADYSFLNEALARVYGISGVSGTDLRKVPYGDGRRAGLLSHGSVLASHAHSNQTSPVRRGLFVRRNLLCQDLPPPPPNAGAVPDVNANATTRERFAQHTASAFCKSCHQYIDSIGLGFERFDAIGAYRETENGKPVDPSGDLNDPEILGGGSHSAFTTLPMLAQSIAGSARARACFVKQAFRASRGYHEQLSDLCTLDGLQARFQQSGYDVRELLIALTLSPDFVRRR